MQRSTQPCRDSTFANIHLKDCWKSKFSELQHLYMAESTTENHRVSCPPPLLGKTGDLPGNFSCDLEEVTKANRFVRPLWVISQSFTWMLAIQGSKRNHTPSRYHLMTLPYVQIRNWRSGPPSLVPLHCPLNTPENNSQHHYFGAFESAAGGDSSLISATVNTKIEGKLPTSTVGSLISSTGLSLFANSE